MIYREIPSICLRCANAIDPARARNGMCPPCDAIRSIRIGVTLCERFGTIMRRGTSLTEGRYDAELEVGEAEQMYPEIWSHFDNARAALAAAGVAVPAYDELRATAHGDAIVDVALNGGKVFYLNAEGHAAATDAGRVLQATLPDVDWQALDRADANEIAAAGGLTIPAWKRWLVGTAIVAGAIALFAIFH